MEITHTKTQQTSNVTIATIHARIVHQAMIALYVMKKTIIELCLMVFLVNVWRITIKTPILMSVNIVLSISLIASIASIILLIVHLMLIRSSLDALNVKQATSCPILNASLQFLVLELKS